MKITVLNGSPKGEQSITMQYVHLIQKKFPQHELTILHIAQCINTLEKNERAFQDTLETIEASDAVLWGFPLYFLMVHGNYKRFIELIWERNAQEAFRGKYASALTSSIKFYDHTAHNYIQAVSEDLGMHYISGYSAAMDDLMKPEERKRLSLFAESLFEQIEQARPCPKHYTPLSASNFRYQPALGSRTLETQGKKIVVVADIEDKDSNIAGMVRRFTETFAGSVKLFRLNEIDMKGGCLGCIQCGYDNVCVWDAKDGYHQWYRDELMTADILIFAGAMRDRYLSSRWKTFFDRQFFHGHAPRLVGKQLGFLISGPLGQNSNLRQILEVMAETEQTNLLDIVTDECGDSETLDTVIQHLAERALWCAENKYIKPFSFLYVGGRKIFRDEIWGHLRFVFRADHRFYKTHGIYDDFPQRDYTTRMRNFLGAIVMKVPAFRERFYKKEIKPGMIRGLQKAVEQS